MRNSEIEVQLPLMEQWLKDVFDYYILNKKDKKIIIKSVRLCGKSILAEILLVAASLLEEGSVSVIVSPVLSLSKKMFDEIGIMCEDLLSKKNGASFELTFINNSKILFKSAEQGDTIRGTTAKKSGILIIDEAAYIPDNLFYEILLPLTNVYHNDVFIFSTPKFLQGFFYDLYLQGLDELFNCKTFDWCNYDLSKYLSKETLEIYRKQMPKNAFKSEYEGQFITGEGAVFNNFNNCLGDIKKDNRQLLVIGIDWSTGSGLDSTVMTIGQLIDNKIYIQDILAFNDKNAVLTIDFIMGYVDNKVKDNYHEILLVVEKNSIGKVFGDLLRERLNEYEDKFNERDWRNRIGLTMSYFNTNNKSKEQMIKLMCVLFENLLIVIPGHLTLIQQLTAYEVKVSASLNLIFNAPNKAGAHDDMVMSLGFVTNYFYNYIER